MEFGEIYSLTKQPFYLRPGQPIWEYKMWNFQDFLPPRFNVKSILVILKPQKQPFQGCRILGSGGARAPPVFRMLGVWEPSDYTVWKFQNISPAQILREINF